MTINDDDDVYSVSVSLVSLCVCVCVCVSRWVYNYVHQRIEIMKIVKIWIEKLYVIG